MEDKAEKFWKDEEKERKTSRDKTVVKAQDKVQKQKEPEHEIIERPKTKVNLNGEKVRDGLAQLILTVVELLRELMEKQALRRMELGSLTEEQIENLGTTFMKLKEEIQRLKEYFHFEDEDLSLDLGPLGLNLTGETTDEKASVVEILDRLLRKGVLVKGDIVISVADVDLISLNLGLLLASIDKARELYGGSEARTAQLAEEVRRLKEENLKLKNASHQI